MVDIKTEESHLVGWSDVSSIKVIPPQIRYLYKRSMVIYLYIPKPPSAKTEFPIDNRKSTSN